VRKWTAVSKALERYLRLKTFPVAFKLFESATALDGIKGIRRPDYMPRMCQLITLARVHGWTLGVTKEQLGSLACASIIGLCEPPKELIEGMALSGILYKTAKDAREHEMAVPRLLVGKYKALAVAPLAGNKFDPDIILIYGNPAQIFVLIAAIQWEDFEPLQFYCVGESSCSDAIVRCYVTSKPSLGIPPYAERRYGYAQDDEMVMGLPVTSVDKVLRGLKGIYKGGIRYPIPCWGAQASAPSLLRTGTTNVSNRASGVLPF
jgi:uncharacterized protein (DUF169 family)